MRKSTCNTIVLLEKIKSLEERVNFLEEKIGKTTLKAKEVAADLTKLPKEGVFLGKNQGKAIYISPQDKARHFLVLGKSGMGKTEFLWHLLIQDIQAGRNVVVLDPHGDLVEDILPFIPAERTEDVIYFDPSSLDRSLGINMLESQTDEDRFRVASFFVDFFYAIYDPKKTLGLLGPRFEHAVRNAILTVANMPGATVLEIVRVLTDDAYLNKVLPLVTDPLVKSYWQDQRGKTDKFHQSEILDYVVSKFNRFTTDKTLRNVFGQSKTTIDFRSLFQEKRILLADLSRGKIGEENSMFCEVALLEKIYEAALWSYSLPTEEPLPLSIYIDDFESLPYMNFVAGLIAEGRKMHTSFTLALQMLSTLGTEMQNVLLGNIGSWFIFQTARADAELLEYALSPSFTKDDLMQLPPRQACAKLYVKEQTLQPFGLDTTKDLDRKNKSRNEKLAEMVKQLSLLKFGVDKREIEAEIKSRFST